MCLMGAKDIYIMLKILCRSTYIAYASLLKIARAFVVCSTSGSIPILNVPWMLFENIHQSQRTYTLFLPFPCAPLCLSFLLPRNKFIRATWNTERYSHGVSCGRGQRRRRRMACTLSTHSATLTEKAHAVDFPFSRIKISIPIQRIYLFGVSCMHIERVCTQIAVQCTVRWLLMFISDGNGEFYSWSLEIAISPKTLTA